MTPDTSRDHRPINQGAIEQALGHIIEITKEIKRTEEVDCELRFARADWLLHVSTMLDRDEIPSLAETIGEGLSLVRQEIWMAKRWPKSRRRTAVLSWSLHRELATRPDEVVDAVCGFAEENGYGDQATGRRGHIPKGEAMLVVSQFDPPAPEVNFLTMSRTECCMALAERDHRDAIFCRVSRALIERLVGDVLRYSAEYDRARGETGDAV